MSQTIKRIIVAPATCNAKTEERQEFIYALPTNLQVPATLRLGAVGDEEKMINGAVFSVEFVNEQMTVEPIAIETVTAGTKFADIDIPFEVRRSSDIYTMSITAAVSQDDLDKQTDVKICVVKFATKGGEDNSCLSSSVLEAITSLSASYGELSQTWTGILEASQKISSVAQDDAQTQRLALDSAQDLLKGQLDSLVQATKALFADFQNFRLVGDHIPDNFHVVNDSIIGVATTLSAVRSLCAETKGLSGLGNEKIDALSVGLKTLHDGIVAINTQVGLLVEAIGATRTTDLPALKGACEESTAWAKQTTETVAALSKSIADLTSAIHVTASQLDVIKNRIVDSIAHVAEQTAAAIKAEMPAPAPPLDVTTLVATIVSEIKTALPPQTIDVSSIAKAVAAEIVTLTTQSQQPKANLDFRRRKPLVEEKEKKVRARTFGRWAVYTPIILAIATIGGIVVIHYRF